MLTSSIPFLQLSVILGLMRLQIAKFCFCPGHDRAHNRLSNVIAALKQLFAVVSRSNIHLSLHHIPSRFNFADTPSRRFSLLDSMLSSDTWAQVQGHFGGPSGHSVDLMALPSNVQHASSGHPLPFFSLCLRQGLQGLMFSLSFRTITHILKAGAPADLLSQNVSPDNPAADIYRDFNHLKNFILAFPSTELLKRKAPDS